MKWNLAKKATLVSIFTTIINIKNGSCISGVYKLIDLSLNFSGLT